MQRLNKNFLVYDHFFQFALHTDHEHRLVVEQDDVDVETRRHRTVNHAISDKALDCLTATAENLDVLGRDAQLTVLNFVIKVENANESFRCILTLIVFYVEQQELSRVSR